MSKQIGPSNIGPIAPPIDITPAAGNNLAGNNPEASSKGVSTISYIGLSLHQGSMPFVSLNGIHITFSPVLLGTIGISALLSVTSIESFPESTILPLLFILLLFSQLAGNLIAGWLLSVRPHSLILSFSGVIDPGLIIKRKNPLLRDLDDERFAPIRAFGSSLATVFFLLAIQNTPIRNIIPEHPLLVNAFWAFASFLVIAPFLPPHRMSENFKERLIEGILPVCFFSIAMLASYKTFPFTLGFPEFAFFILALVLRKFWWSRITLVSELAGQITLKEAMIPIEHLEVFSHGLTIGSAQKIALSHPQNIFPIITGNRLAGYVRREELFRATPFDSDDQFVPSVSESALSFADPETKVETCFGPGIPLPLFVLEENQVIGLVNADQVRDSLLLALSRNAITSL